ncbi:MAG TPA: GerMN domain-containing protein [Patescibacteria group bacterium]
MSLLKYLFALVAFLVVMASVWWVVSGQTNLSLTDQPSPTPSPNPTYQVYLVALEGTHAETETFGCGDVLVPVTRPADSTPTLKMAISQLKHTVERTVTENNIELYNALHQSALNIEQAEIRDGVAIISLQGQLRLGGVCDEPRVEEQIKATARQFPGVNEVRILVNGEPLP